MSLSAEAIDALVKSGASAEMLAAVMKAELAADEARRIKQRENAKLRKQKQRAKIEAVTRDIRDIAGQRVTERDIVGQAVTQDAGAPTYVRGEDNLSRLVDTSSAVAVVEDARDPICDWPPGDATRHAQLLAEAAGTGRLDPAKQSGLTLTAGRLLAWKRDGASWIYDVVPAVVVMSQKRGPPIGTWKYFDKAIAQSIADNRQALTIPAANGARNDRPRQSSAKFDAKQANMERSLRGAEIASARRAF